MKNDIFEQLIGSVYKCKEYSEEEYKNHYDVLKEADEFCAAASLYADERLELLANSLHKYQHLIDTASEILNLETDFLLKKKICFNFYTDIANLFGLGTQAYTTETEVPYIGISELSIQDIYLLQLILLHEMQHATDFVYFDGFSMGIAERELRARITICHSLNEIQKQFSKLYRNAYLDQAYWYVIMFASPNVDEKIKKEYFELLEKKAKNLLSDEVGVVFSPLILRVFGRELLREGVSLKPNIAYKILDKNGLLIMEESESTVKYEDSDISETEEHITSDLDTYEGDEPLSIKLARITGEKMVDGNSPLILTKNKMMEWHTYQDEFKELKKQASVVITRNSESFINIAKPEDTSLGVPKIIKVQPQIYLKGDDTSLRDLRNLDIPNASFNTQNEEEKNFFISNKPYNTNKANKKVVEEEDDLAQNMVNNLSSLFKKGD